MNSPINNEILMKIMHKERELEVERLQLGRQGNPVRAAHEKHFFQWRLVRKALKAISDSVKHKPNKQRRRSCQTSS